MSSSQTTHRASLVVSHGEAVLGRVSLTQERLSIGRRPDNELVLEDLTVSAEHALLCCEGGLVVVADLGSRNGTLVNGRPGHRQVLRHGDRIDIGIYSLQFQHEGGASRAFDVPVPAHLQILSGPRTGQTLSLDGGRVSVRSDSGHLGVITYRRHTHWLTHLDGTGCPLINGEPIGLSTRELEFDDLLEIGGTVFQFCFGQAD